MSHTGTSTLKTRSTRVGLAAIMVAMFALLAAACGTTSAGSIDVGDCFEDPGSGGFARVTDQDCDGPHDIQIFATAFSTGLLSDPCGDKMIELFTSSDILEDPLVSIPDDVVMGEIGEEASGGGEVLCFIESPSGQLIGSIVP